MNRDWINAQFTEAKVRVGVGKAVLKLLETWETIDLTPQQQRDALSTFETLALGHSIVMENKDEVWIDAAPGQIVVGDMVRVKHDAFDGELGATHNGRRCKIIAIRSGDVIVDSVDGKMPALKGSHYSPFKLQKRIK